jgi:hypothetical protein
MRQSSTQMVYPATILARRPSIPLSVGVPRFKIQELPPSVNPGLKSRLFHYFHCIHVVLTSLSDDEKFKMRHPSLHKPGSSPHLTTDSKMPLTASRNPDHDLDGTCALHPLWRSTSVRVWVVGWLVCRLVSWLVGWLIRRLVALLVGWSVDQLVVRLLAWLSWLVGLSACWLVGWLISLLVCCLVCLFVGW